LHGVTSKTSLFAAVISKSASLLELAGMQKAEFHRMLQACLRSISHRPIDACTLKGTDCPLAKRRWEGRSPEAEPV
jgi:hypothetical protein